MVAFLFTKSTLETVSFDVKTSLFFFYPEVLQRIVSSLFEKKVYARALEKLGCQKHGILAFLCVLVTAADIFTVLFSAFRFVSPQTLK